MPPPHPAYPPATSAPSGHPTHDRAEPVDRCLFPRYLRRMRWPATCKLLDRIRQERPELSVNHYALGAPAEPYGLHVCCLMKGSAGDIQSGPICPSRKGLPNTRRISLARAAKLAVPTYTPSTKR